jgi:hypothetical protein
MSISPITQGDCNYSNAVLSVADGGWTYEWVNPHGGMVVGPSVPSVPRPSRECADVAPKTKRTRNQLEQAATERAAMIATLVRARTASALLTMGTFVGAITATFLAVQGEMNPAWHRITLELAVLSGFAFIAAACTLLCVTVMRNIMQTVCARMDEMERHLGQGEDESIAKAVASAIDAMHIAQLSAGVRREDR